MFKKSGSPLGGGETAATSSKLIESSSDLIVNKQYSKLLQSTKKTKQTVQQILQSMKKTKQTVQQTL